MKNEDVSRETCIIKMDYQKRGKMKEKVDLGQK